MEGVYHTLTAEELWAKFEAWKEAESAKMDEIKRATLLAAKNVWTVEDLALYLNRTKKTIYNQLESIPHYHNGSSVVFKREDIEAWQLGQNLTNIS